MNRVCEALGIQKPLIQGPMAWISTAPLVAAVSNAGGLGVLGVGFAPEGFIREQIAATRALTDKPFGMNVIMDTVNLAGELASKGEEDDENVIDLSEPYDMEG